MDFCDQRVKADEERQRLGNFNRRSGTHLTIDSIRNNFKALRETPLLTLETLDCGHPDHLSVSEFRRIASEQGRVLKTHYCPNVAEQFIAEEAGFVNDVLSQSKRIYVVKSGLDVPASFYEFRRGHDPQVREMSFSQFIREPSFDRRASSFDKVTYWAHHVESWLNAPRSKQLLVRHFEQWVDDYHATIKKVAQFLGLSKDRFVKRLVSQRRANWIHPR